MAEATASTPVRMLIINPNTSTHMTDALKPMVKNLGYHSVEYTFFTCPSNGIASIDSPTDASSSADFCLPHLIPLLPHHDTFLVACYSQHPLVSTLKAECAKLTTAAARGGEGVRKYVTGIFEASVTTSLSLSTSNEGFGIVSTGKVWEEALEEAVNEMFGTSESIRFQGCETTGLNASELHDLPADQVRQRMMEATARLITKGRKRGQKVASICLGCAGMVGLDEAVRTACIEELGEKGKDVHIVDGVIAGVGTLLALARGGF